MKLSHYSAEPLGKLIPGDQTRGCRECFKPRGLWVSVDGEHDWPAWCKGEEFGLDRLLLRQRIILTPAANILHLQTPKELDDFTTKYRSTPHFSDIHLEWDRVAEEYQGILIAPYQWSRRLELMWYYSWDCASGCIWDITAIERVEPAETYYEYLSTKNVECGEGAAGKPAHS